MDIDHFLKSATEEEMELMMDFFPDISDYNNHTPLPPHHHHTMTSSVPSSFLMMSPPESESSSSMAAMREVIFRIAAMQPIHIDPESVKAPKRRNVKISKDPQSVAARHRRERISERIRILQRLVPGGTKMDTASMLDEAIHYVKFLKSQVQTLEMAAATGTGTAGFPVTVSKGTYVPMPYQQQTSPNFSHFGSSN